MLRILRREKQSHPAAAALLRQMEKVGDAAIEFLPLAFPELFLSRRVMAETLAKFGRGGKALLCVNRDHWGIEIMHRNKDVIPGEDGYTNRLGNAPRNIFSLTSFALKILRSVSPSPTRAIEHFQDDRNRAIRLFSDFY